MDIRVKLPRSAQVFRKASAAEPLIANAENCEEEASCDLDVGKIAADASAMAAAFSVGAQLTTSTTIDLTAAPDARTGIAQNCNAKYPTVLEFTAPDTNTAAVTIAPHGTNGYSDCPTASIKPGGRVLLDYRPKSDGTAPSPRPQVVDATHKQIAVTISGSDKLKWNGAFGA